MNACAWTQFIYEPQLADSLPSVALFASVVIDFYAENNHRAYGGNHVGDNEGPIAHHQSLDHKKNRSQAKHYKRGQRYTLGIARAYRYDSLWQISQYHRYGCGPSKYCQ